MHNRWYVVINVLGFFAIDHVVVSLVNLLKTIVTTGASFSLQFTKNRLAAGLRPDPLGPAERSPKPPSRKKGPTSKGREGRGGKGIGWERNGREGWERRGQERKEGKREGS